MSLTYKRIVVAVDGSAEAEAAFEQAIEIVKRNEGAALLITHVIDTRIGIAETYDTGVISRIEESGHELLKKYEDQAKKAGLDNVATELKHGSPKAIIAKKIAPDFNADLIICGATGLNRVERFIVGSVAEHTTRYAKCDVLIVRADKKE
ncbi:universal stress protein [Bacillus carboniphilus]|uniref:Universal stress protein n=1 Tax=Bacillus carboniphilus TaxID=86663 RepID=A0ABY9JU92_9BACI|nr:universal stress protein [Bacillus carboniphilus]WLR42981.1 universal stress protein [Bacillus carboniphilus]